MERANKRKPTPAELLAFVTDPKNDRSFGHPPRDIVLLRGDLGKEQEQKAPGSSQ